MLVTPLRNQNASGLTDSSVAPGGGQQAGANSWSLKYLKSREARVLCIGADVRSGPELVKRIFSTRDKQDILAWR
jgi:hypothetical protein